MRTFLIVFDILVDMGLLVLATWVMAFQDSGINWAIICGAFAVPAIAIVATYFGITSREWLLWGPIFIVLILIVLIILIVGLNKVSDEKEKKHLDSLTKDFICLPADKPYGYDAEGFLSIQDSKLMSYIHFIDSSTMFINKEEIFGEIKNNQELQLTKENKDEGLDLLRKCKNKDNKNVFESYVVKDISGKVVK